MATRIDEPADLAMSRALVPMVAEKFEAAHPGTQVIGVDIVLVTVRHDGTEEHSNCKIEHRHIGGTAKDGDRELMQHMVDAVTASAENLLERAQAMRLADKTEVSH